MDFKSAVDALAGCYSHEELAKAAGVSLQSIRQARLDPSSPSYRRPPANWREIIARLARARGGELGDLAEELEAEE